MPGQRGEAPRAQHVDAARRGVETNNYPREAVKGPSAAEQQQYSDLTGKWSASVNDDGSGQLLASRLHRAAASWSARPMRPR